MYRDSVKKYDELMPKYDRWAIFCDPALSIGSKFKKYLLNKFLQDAPKHGNMEKLGSGNWFTEMRLIEILCLLIAQDFLVRLTGNRL